MAYVQASQASEIKKIGEQMKTELEAQFKALWPAAPSRTAHPMGPAAVMQTQLTRIVVASAW